MKIFWIGRRKAISLMMLGICSLFASGQGRVSVMVDNFESDKGLCRACLFKDAASFAGGGQPVQCKQARILNKKAVIEFSDIPEGNYAVALFHDANENGKMDKNFLGIPKEGYGASKNKLPFAAAPKFEDNKFSVQSGKLINLPVHLRYIL